MRRLSVEESVRISDDFGYRSWRVLHSGRNDRAGKWKWCFVEVVHRYGRTEVGAKVEAVVGREEQRGQEWDSALRDLFGVDAQSDGVAN